MTRYVNPFPQHFDANGDPNTSYRAFFGEPNQDPKLFPKSPFSDEALTVPIGATQILDATGSYGIDIFLKGLYSIRIETALGSLFRESPSITGIGIGEEGVNFETVADMVAEASLTIDTWVTVQDYAVGRNSGVLFFKVVAADTGTADGGSLIDLTGASLQAQQNFRPHRTYKQFGAVGDGTTSGGGTDDTTAMNNTYASAKAALVPLHITEGDYRFTSQLDWDGQIDVRGAGRLQCNLIKDGSFDGILLSDFDGAHYSDFGMLGATGNTGRAIDIFVGHRITMNNIRVRTMGGDGIVMRGGNQAAFRDIKITLCGAVGFEINSGTGFPGASANAGKYDNLDLNGSDINFKITAGGINKCKSIICQNAVTMNAQLVDSTDVERNTVELYTEFEGTSVSDIGGVANDIYLAQGEVTNSGTFNRILDFNQAGTEKPQYRELFFAKAVIQDRDADPANSQSWDIFEAGTAAKRILNIHSNGSAALPALIDIRQPAGSVVDLTLVGTFSPNAVIPKLIATRTTTDTTPTVDGANTLSSTTDVAPGTITNLDDGEVGQVVTILADQATGILTISNGTIELDSGVDFLMDPGDTLTVGKYVSGTWREISRMER